MTAGSYVTHLKDWFPLQEMSQSNTKINKYFLGKCFWNRPNPVLCTTSPLVSATGIKLKKAKVKAQGHFLLVLSYQNLISTDWTAIASVHQSEADKMTFQVGHSFNNTGVEWFVEWLFPVGLCTDQMFKRQQFQKPTKLCLKNSPKRKLTMCSRVVSLTSWNRVGCLIPRDTFGFQMSQIKCSTWALQYFT